MIELAQLFQDVEAAVVQHEPAIEEIEQKAEATNENVGKATGEIDGAIAQVRSRRRKQWWCLAIVCTYIPPKFLASALAMRGKACTTFFHHTNSWLL